MEQESIEIKMARLEERIKAIQYSISGDEANPGLCQKIDKLQNTVYNRPPVMYQYLIGILCSVIGFMGAIIIVLMQHPEVITWIRF